MYPLVKFINLTLQIKNYFNSLLKTDFIENSCFIKLSHDTNGKSNTIEIFL